MIRQVNAEFTQAYDQFIEIFNELNRQPVNIEQYLKDLKKHAMQEYAELIEEEKEAAAQKQQQNQLSLSKSDENKKKKKKRKARRPSQEKELQSLKPADTTKNDKNPAESSEYLHKLDTDDLV